MIRLHKIIATAGGIGYVGKGGGTIAAIVTCLGWYFLIHVENPFTWQIIITLLVTITGTWSSNVVDAFWGKDSCKVVVDEVCGMMITLLFIPIDIKYIFAGLVLFRFFDIAKPLFIKNLEALPKGWGVMADDVLAGIYAHICLMLIVYFHIF